MATPAGSKECDDTAASQGGPDQCDISLTGN